MSVLPCCFSLRVLERTPIDGDAENAEIRLLEACIPLLIQGKYSYNKRQPQPERFRKEAVSVFLQTEIALFSSLSSIIKLARTPDKEQLLTASKL